MNIAKRIIDSHCHIYPQPIASKAVDSIDRFYGVLKDRHHDGTPETLIKSGNEQGITHFIVHSVATKPEQVSSINHFIAKSTQIAEGAFTGLGAIHPDSSHLREDIEEICSLGLKGVKMHPDIQRFHADSPKAMKVFELCEEKGLPVLCHTGDYRYDYSNPERIAVVLRTFPRLKFIGAHFGGFSMWDDAMRILPDFPNIMVDTSSSFFWLDRDQARDLIHAYGSERVMFATDYPLWMQKGELEFLKSLDLSQEEYENICWRSCSGLFSLTWE